jgi:hypothetical protein
MWTISIPTMLRTYDFATIGFRPFTETAEFVTIGVVALDVVVRHFDFVDRNGLTAQQAAEQAMAKALCRVLADAKLLPAYKRDVKIGPEEYQVTFAVTSSSKAGGLMLGMPSRRKASWPTATSQSSSILPTDPTVGCE